MKTHPQDLIQNRDILLTYIVQIKIAVCSLQGIIFQYCPKIYYTHKKILKIQNSGV